MKSELKLFPEVIVYSKKLKIAGTVDMFLIFSLNRPDIFPLNDLGIQKGLMLLLGRQKILSRESMLSHSKKWKPYRTLASLYLWKIVDEGMIGL